jgi:hypothetical protein
VEKQSMTTHGRRCPPVEGPSKAESCRNLFQALSLELFSVFPKREETKKSEYKHRWPCLWS